MGTKLLHVTQIIAMYVRALYSKQTYTSQHSRDTGSHCAYGCIRLKINVK